MILNDNEGKEIKVLTKNGGLLTYVPKSVLPSITVYNNFLVLNEVGCLNFIELDTRICFKCE